MTTSRSGFALILQFAIDRSLICVYPLTDPRSCWLKPLPVRESRLSLENLNYRGNMGRKKVPEELHLHVSATCRMTIEELDAVRAAARNAGLTNSKFLRYLIQKHVVLQAG
jgi:hypothetical protein